MIWIRLCEGEFLKGKKNAGVAGAQQKKISFSLYSLSQAGVVQAALEEAIPIG